MKLDGDYNENGGWKEFCFLAKCSANATLFDAFWRDLSQLGTAGGSAGCVRGVVADAFCGQYGFLLQVGKRAANEEGQGSFAKRRTTVKQANGAGGSPAKALARLSRHLKRLGLEQKEISKCGSCMKLDGDYNENGGWKEFCFLAKCSANATLFDAFWRDLSQLGTAGGSAGCVRGVVADALCGEYGGLLQVGKQAEPWTNALPKS